MNWYKRHLLAQKGLYTEAINWADIRKGLLLGGLLASPIAIFMIANALKMSPQQVQQEAQTAPQQLVQKLDRVIPQQVQQQPQQVQQQPQQTQSPSTEEIRSFIAENEGRRNRVYPDTKGIPTIGIGFNLNRSDASSRLQSVGADYDQVRKGKVSLTDRQVDALFEQDLSTAQNAARSFLPNIQTYPPGIQIALTDLAFNLGGQGLANFHNFQRSLSNRNFEQAAKDLRNSRWYGQVGNRAERVISLILSGDN